MWILWLNLTAFCFNSRHYNSWLHKSTIQSFSFWYMHLDTSTFIIEVVAVGSGSGSGLYSGGLTWSIVLRCDDHTGIFTCDGCARDLYFCRQLGLNSAPLGYNDLESATLATAQWVHCWFIAAAVQFLINQAVLYRVRARYYKVL